ncbi:MAG: hypothetical protein ACREPU_02095 [Rhodanobacteraceae bacterium]
MNGRTKTRLEWFMLFALVAFIFLSATSQLGIPFIRQDDLDFLMPGTWHHGYATPWEKTLTEGRWINYLWYQVSQHLSANAAYLLFITAYFFFVCALARFVSNNRLLFLCGLAMFFSPMFGQVSLWPSALISSVALCALSMWLLFSVSDRWIVPTLAIFTILVVGAYPTLASIPLLALAVREADSSTKKKMIYGVTYVCAYGFAVLAICTLNLLFHGHFGVQIASWRHPQPLRSLADFGAGIMRYGHLWRDLWVDYTIPVVFGVVSLALLWFRSRTRRICVSILLAAGLVSCIELGIVLVGGTGMPVRAMAWVWVAICLLCGIVAAQDERLLRYVGAIFLAVLAVSGASAWWTEYRSVQPEVQYESRLAAWIHQYQATAGVTDVTVVGDPRHVADLRPLFGPDPMPALRMSMFKRYGIKLDDCAGVICEKVQGYLQSQGDHVQPLFVLDGRLVVVFDRRGDPVQRGYPSASEEAALKLRYPIFLRYDSNSARVVPFFPGTSERPVSVKLAPGADGYTLQMQGTKCAYPVIYKLVASNADDLASGRYTGSNVMYLPGWSRRIGTATLTLRMAEGAANNYSCNLVIRKN